MSADPAVRAALDKYLEPPPNPLHDKDCRWYSAAAMRHINQQLFGDKRPRWGCSPECRKRQIILEENL